MKKPKYRRFDYQPRFYNPEKDPTERRKQRLKFRYARKHKTSFNTTILWLAILLAALFVYLKYNGLI